MLVEGNVRVHRSTCSEDDRTQVRGWRMKRPYLVPEISRGVVLLAQGGLRCSKVHETIFFQSSLVLPCVFSHGMEFICGVWNEPLVPHISEGGRSPPGLVVAVPVEEFGSFHKLCGVAVPSSCSA